MTQTAKPGGSPPGRIVRPLQYNLLTAFAYVVDR